MFDSTFIRGAVVVTFLAVGSSTVYAEDDAQNRRTKNTFDELRDEVFGLSDQMGQASENIGSIRYNVLSKLSRYIIKTAKPEEGE